MPHAIKVNLPNPKILEWARKEIGLSEVDVANRFNKSEETITSWENGYDAPTFRQLSELANYYKRPLAILFLPSIPPEFPKPYDHLALIKLDNFIISMVGFVVLLAFSYFILEKKSDIASEGKKDVRYTGRKLTARVIFSGAMVALAVLLAKVSGPLWGGIFSVFPAVYISIIFITHFAHGKSFSLATLKVALLSGQVNVIIFVVTARYTYLHLGLLWGTILPYLASLAGTVFLYYYVTKKVS